MVPDESVTTSRHVAFMDSASPRARSHRRGHLIVAYDDCRWQWPGTGRWLRYGSRPNDPPCVLCGRPPTPEGFDACIGEVVGARSVCCGHGVVDGHVKYPGSPIAILPRLIDAPHHYPHPIPTDSRGAKP